MLLEALLSAAIAFTLPTLAITATGSGRMASHLRLAAQQKPTMSEAEFKTLKDEVEEEVRGINQTTMELEAARLASAHSRIDRALAVWPKDAALHHLKAQVYSFEKEAKSAEAELRRSIELDPEYLPSYSSLAALYINTNQPELATKVLRQLIERKPSAKAYSLLGTVELNRKDFEAAAENYRRALDLDPNSDIAANNLAWLHSEAEWKVLDLDEAVRLARGVVERLPEEPAFADTLGWAYFRKGLYTEALKHLSKAVSLARERGMDSEFFRFHLGMALAASGDKKGAQRELLKALELGGDGFKQADQARKVLASL